MSATIERPTEISSQSQRPLSEELRARVDEFGLQSNVDQIRDEGYTVVSNIASEEFTAKLRETCLRLIAESKTKNPLGPVTAKLLGRDPIFEEVVLNAKIQALVEVMCGKGALLSQLIASVRPKGAFVLPLHADFGSWSSAPYPVQNQLLTMCWTMEEFSQEAGATRVVPKSHLHRRAPSPDESKQAEGAIAIECAANSIACWDNSIWHGNYPREIEGERVVLHITFGRLQLRTVENYDHLDEAWLEGKAPELSIMLGREDHFGKSTINGPDFKRIMNTAKWVNT